MGKEMEVNIPEWFKLDELTLLTTILDKENHSIGTLFAGDNFEQTKGYNPIIRVYLIRFEKDCFEIVKEIGALSFKSTEDALHFLSKLQEYSAIDLIFNLHRQEISIAV